MIRFSNGVEVQTTSVSGAAEMMRQHRRDVITIKTTGIEYADAAELFSDGASWSIVEVNADGNGDPIETVYDYSNYTMAGSITDNRDGSLVVKMGRANTKEETLEDELVAEKAKTATLENDKATLTQQNAALAAENEDKDAQIDDLVVAMLEGGTDDVSETDETV